MLMIPQNTRHQLVVYHCILSSIKINHNFFLFWIPLNSFFFSIYVTVLIRKTRLRCVFVCRTFRHLDLLGGDCSGRGGDKSPGDLGGLNNPHTDSSSSVMLVYSVCMCISKPARLLPVTLVGGITLILGSVKVTLRSKDTVLEGILAAAGGSEVSGSDWVWENCRLGNVALLVSEEDSSPERHFFFISKVNWVFTDSSEHTGRHLLLSEGRKQAGKIFACAKLCYQAEWK